MKIQYVELPTSTSITTLRSLCGWDQPDQSNKWRLMGSPSMHHPWYLLSRTTQEPLPGKTYQERGRSLFNQMNLDWPWEGTT